MTPVLSVRKLDKRFGAVVAADALTLDIAAGQKVSLIGANGAGKTTFVNMVTGYLKPDTGSIVFEGKSLVGLSPRQITQRGISHSFQIPQLFQSLREASFDRLAESLRDTDRLLPELPALGDLNIELRRNEILPDLR